MSTVEQLDLLPVDCPIPLQAWIRTNNPGGLSKLARRTGVTVGGIRKMYLSERQITVVDAGAGRVKLYEIKLLNPAPGQG